MSDELTIEGHMKEDELFRAYEKSVPENKKGIIRDPALGVAVAKCLIARMMGPQGISASAHPYPCRICQVPDDEMWPIYNEWMDWSLLMDNVPDEDAPAPVEAFMRLDPKVQRSLVFKAQGYGEDEEGKPTPSEESWSVAEYQRKKRGQVTG